MNRFNDYVSALGRALLAVLFLVSGVGKIAAPTATIGYISSVGLPFPTIGYGLSAALELGGGLLLLFGYRTRAISLAFAVYSVITAVIFHNNLADQNQMFNFLKDFAVAGGLLQLFTRGAGSISVDAKRER